jgi:hypothetical protein
MLQKALGLGGKVTISHGFCLGGVTERKAAEAAETMAEAEPRAGARLPYERALGIRQRLLGPERSPRAVPAPRAAGTG